MGNHALERRVADGTERKFGVLVLGFGCMKLAFSQHTLFYDEPRDVGVAFSLGLDEFLRWRIRKKPAP